LLGLCTNFQLVGESSGTNIRAEEIKVIAGNGEVVKHLREILLHKPLSAAVPAATTYLVGKGPKGYLRHLIVKGSEAPSIDAGVRHGLPVRPGRW
ncbi:MAG TPA: hypothetical protein VI653_15000, partial [Steroidobacteraceae bacterium]